MVYYGLNVENENLISAKAKEKADGVYQFRGIVYRVKNCRVTHVTDHGRILERFGHFNVEVGSYDNLSQAKKALKSFAG